MTTSDSRAALMLLALGSWLVLGNGAPPRVPEVRVHVLPEKPYLEETECGLAANWDLLVENDGERPWELARVQVSAFDAAGALAWRRFVDGNGVSPGLLTIPVRRLAAHGTLLLLNPVYALPGDLEPARLTFELSFEGAGSSDALTVSADATPRRYVNQCELHLPLAGRILVWDGHDFYAHHRRWDYTVEGLASLGFDGNAARYSYDFVPVDEHGAMSHGDEGANENWLGFGRPILAPAAGTVVAVVDSKPDDRTLDVASLAADLRNVFGNYVVVDHGHGEHSVFGHLQKGSARVSLGDAVVPGQVLAAIGASGSSLFPHLHYQLQDASGGHAEGLPSTFHAFRRVRGTTPRAVAAGPVASGDLLESEPVAPPARR